MILVQHSMFPVLDLMNSSNFMNSSKIVMYKYEIILVPVN